MELFIQSRNMVADVRSILIPAVDTWFGIVVKPSEQTQLNFTTSSNHSFGRGLIQGQEECMYSYYFYPCEALKWFGPDGTPTPYLPTDTETFKILNNISTENVVSKYSSNSSQSLYYLSDAASLSSNWDFKASAVAISTHCDVVRVECIQDDREIFDCTQQLSNRVNEVTKVDFTFYGDSSLSQNISFPNYAFINPLYFTVSMIIGKQYHPQPGILGGSMELSCSSTTFDATYAWVDGSVAQFNVTPTNGSLGGVMSAPFINENANISQQAVMSTMARLSTNFSDAVPLTAAAFSHSALALSYIAMENRSNIIEQSRAALSLTRVPIIPFYILIVLNALYVLCTILLAMTAMIWAHPKESTAVKSQLTLEGFMTAVFNGEGIKAQTQASESSDASSDRTEAVKEDVLKIAILKTGQGKWFYATVTNNNDEAVVRCI